MAALVFIFLRIRADGRPESDYSLVISVDGETVFDEDLDTLSLPFEYLVEGDGGENVFLLSYVQDPSAGNIVGISCIYSDCPNQICVETGTVTAPDTPIVCLPHKVIATLRAE